jgi:ATP-dependent DNA ligase
LCSLLAFVGVALMAVLKPRRLLRQCGKQSDVTVTWAYELKHDGYRLQIMSGMDRLTSKAFVGADYFLLGTWNAGRQAELN